MISVTLPIRTMSEANVHAHWRTRHRRARSQRFIMCLAIVAHVPRFSLESPVTVTLTRIAPRKLDGDNLQSACKAIRDGVADALGVDDGDARVEWRYAQERGEPKEYAVRVEIGRREATVSEEHTRDHREVKSR